MTPFQFSKRISKLFNTHQEAADALGVTRGCVGHWLNGRRPVPGTVEKLIECIEARGKGQDK
jgi:DNA-binding transcriptional regulator YiaG